MQENDERPELSGQEPLSRVVGGLLLQAEARKIELETLGVGPRLGEERQRTVHVGLLLGAASTNSRSPVTRSPTCCTRPTHPRRTRSSTSR